MCNPQSRIDAHLTDTERLGYDAANLPAHYTRFPIEPVYFIMMNGLDFATGNVIKYVVRAPHKNGIEDLKKARRYLDMMIAKAEDREDFHK